MKTDDIRVAMGWGVWLDRDGIVRRPLQATPYPMEFKRPGDRWRATEGVGRAPYTKVARKPAPATLGECMAASGSDLQAKRTGRAPHRGPLTWGTTLRTIRSADVTCTDWVCMVDGEWVSPNGEVDDDGCDCDG